ncbi:sensor histidine kinase [Catellatospora vulcania]|uniref:sensor histidine kinase n=1 Tax=Catellatospora vulcania TaxID=1460450 RepID=UPI0012D40F8C|nr:sensor histidine kinase [Catellatospora vulcania]
MTWGMVRPADLSRRAWSVDVGLTLLVLAAQSAPYFFTRRLPEDGSWTFAAYWPVLVTSLPVLLRRWQPTYALLLTAVGIAAYAIAGTGPAQPIWYGPLVCFYAVAYQSPPRQRLVVLVVTAAGMLSIIQSVNTAVREMATWSAAYMLGTLARTRREAAARERAQAAQLAAERERTRIARDLHDILGHAFSLMVVQAEAGGAIARRDPVRAEAAFDAISDAGRSAMAQLRAAVGGLREPSAPQPGLADLPELVRGTRHDGLDVSFTEHGDPRPLAPDVQLAVYRVVQEALTNVVRHAAATSARVSLTWDGGCTRVSVADDGRGTGPVTPGNGLVGLGERVAAAGGLVEFGPDPAGGFRVTAVFG